MYLAQEIKKQGYVFNDSTVNFTFISNYWDNC